MRIVAARRTNPDDLLILLTVARSGRFTRAAETLGLNHVTVARRISALERSLGGKLLVRTGSGWAPTPLGERAIAAGERVDSLILELETGPDTDADIEDVVRLSSPDGFTVAVAAPAAAQLHRQYPGVSVEIVSVTRRAAQHRSGVDLEVVVGEPSVVRAESLHLGNYLLGMYASQSYLQSHPTPRQLDDLVQHRLVYFIGTVLQVDYLDVARKHLPDMRDSVTSTNVFAHIEATRYGGGVGLLPTFMADRHDDLVRLLPGIIEIPMDYWLVARADALRRPAVAAVVEQLRSTIEEVEGLIGLHDS
jgi:DNA-binding transcriptional LysR family regulator